MRRGYTKRTSEGGKQQTATHAKEEDTFCQRKRTDDDTLYCFSRELAGEGRDDRILGSFKCHPELTGGANVISVTNTYLACCAAASELTGCKLPVHFVVHLQRTYVCIRFLPKTRHLFSSKWK